MCFPLSPLPNGFPNLSCKRHNRKRSVEVFYDGWAPNQPVLCTTPHVQQQGQLQKPPGGRCPPFLSPAKRSQSDRIGSERGVSNRMPPGSESWAEGGRADCEGKAREPAEVRMAPATRVGDSDSSFAESPAWDQEQQLARGERHFQHLSEIKL